MTDYSDIGMKCGIEIHQRLDTSKLFCPCISVMGGHPCAELKRHLRVVAGETGGIDRAALQETINSREFVYKIYPGSSCLVEMDCEPPHDLNMRALDAALEIAVMLNCEIPEEIHFMRKTVIDGSNTAGFQRTAIVGLNGWIETPKGRVGITSVCLEEESAQILGKEEGRTIYGLDRLGIPLVEIGTSPDIKSPEHAREVAETLGILLRSTGKVQRGLGTIRQDVNVSIAKGARVEIKGVQDLKLIPIMVEHEIRRQLSIIETAAKVRSMALPAEMVFKEVTGFFTGHDSAIVKGKKVYATVIPGFAGMFKSLLTPGRTLGNEVAAHVRAKLPVRGFVHSDEPLEKYGFEKHFREIRDCMKAAAGDTLIIVAGEEGLCRRTVAVIGEKVRELAAGVQEETRKALESGESEYMRPLPGAARLYPETDVLPVRIYPVRIEKIKKNLPESWESKIKRIAKQYGISLEVSKQIVRAGDDDILEAIVKLGFDAGLVARVLTSTMKDLKRRENVPVENLSGETIVSLFSALKGRSPDINALASMLKKLAQEPGIDISRVTGSSEGLSEAEVRKAVQEILKANPSVFKAPKPEQAAMGLAMVGLRGKAPGALVMKVLAEELRKK
jgi:glutamyl-tRNA(Gln) amidotransferase subunit E